MDEVLKMHKAGKTLDEICVACDVDIHLVIKIVHFDKVGKHEL